MNEGTITLPLIYAWKHFPNNESLYKLANCIPITGDEQNDLYNVLCHEKVIKSCRETVNNYIKKAENNLSNMPKNIYTFGLYDLFDYIKQCPWGGVEW